MLRITVSVRFRLTTLLFTIIMQNDKKIKEVNDTEVLVLDKE